MSRYELPTPCVARSLPAIDPYRHRQAYVRVLSALYHAEAAALEGFSLLEDPAYVESSELFQRACRRLVQDETKHLQDIADLVHTLSGGDVEPPTPAMAEFWTAWRSGKLFALPFKASVAALFCLFSEGLGYAFLYNLAHATSDPGIRKVLLDNVEDEKMHLRLSLSILERALHGERGFMADLLVYLAGYGLLARKAARQQRELLEDLGLDFDVVVGSSVRFVGDLLDLVMAKTGRSSVGWKLARSTTNFLGAHPESIRALHLSMYLPTPPFVPDAVYWWGRTQRKKPRSNAKSTVFEVPGVETLAFDGAAE